MREALCIAPQGPDVVVHQTHILQPDQVHAVAHVGHAQVLVQLLDVPSRRLAVVVALVL